MTRGAVEGADQLKQSRALVLLKGAALAAALALVTTVAGRLAPVAMNPAAALLLAVAAVCGYAGSDLLSGSVHWFCDTFFSEETPVIGRLVIWPFRDHHRHPEAITRYALLEQDGTSYFILLPPLAAAAYAGAPDLSRPLALAAQAALCGFALGALGTNLFHKWAHTPAPPRIVCWLQRAGLILSPDAHAVHHRAYTGGYCVTNGWLNPLLDRVAFFSRLERLVRR